MCFRNGYRMQIKILMMAAIFQSIFFQPVEHEFEVQGHAAAAAPFVF